MQNKTAKLMHPQEITVWYILPSLRKAFASVLKEKELAQREIANLLGVTEAAVSQYLNNKRAEEVVFDNKIKACIEKAAERIINGESNHFLETQRLLSTPEVRKQICLIHHQQSTFPKGCAVCFS